MSEFVVDIDPDEWRGAFEILDFYFVEDQQMMDALGIDSAQTLHSQRNGERDFMDSVVAGNILTILNDTDPIIQLGDDPEDHIQDTYNSRGKRAELEEGVAEFFFEPYSTVELAEKANVDRRRAVDYKNGESNPPLELFKECFNEVNYAMKAGFSPEMDIYPVGAYSSPSYTDGDHAFLEEADPEDLEDINAAVKDLQWLKSQRPSGYTGIEKNLDAIEKMKNIVSDPLQTTIKGEELSSSAHFFHGLTEAGIANKTGGKASNYSINVSENYLDALTYLMNDDRT